MEHKLFDGALPYVSTFDFHKDRERAPHLEQGVHRPRLLKAAEFVRAARPYVEAPTMAVSDLGCGDGGLLSLIQNDGDILAWGHDFQPSNQEGWIARGVTASALDVFGEDQAAVELGDVVVMTEVLEHLADPHGVLRWVREKGVSAIVCSSPWTESHSSHCAEHAWAWDMDGYRKMIEEAGWTVARHEQEGMFQVVLGY